MAVGGAGQPQFPHHSRSGPVMYQQVSASTAREPGEVEIVPGEIATGLLLLCDHATNAIPAELASLGLPAAQLERHIAYDIGAAAMTRAIAAGLRAPAVRAHF